MNIMIANYSVSMRERVKNSLSQIADACIVEVEEGRTAIDFINATLPDLIILDWQLLKAQSGEAIRKARCNYPDMKLLLLTNFYQPVKRYEAYIVGADYVFDELTEFDDMVSVVRLLVESAELSAEHAMPFQN